MAIKRVDVWKDTETGLLYIDGKVTDEKLMAKPTPTGQYMKDDGTYDDPAGGGGNPDWGDIGGTLSEQTDLQTALDAKSASDHNHSGTYEPANANIQSHVGSSHAPSNAQANADITKAEIEAKLTGEISSHSHASGGGTITPAVDLVFNGSLSTTTQDTNAVSQDYAWNDAEEHADITHTDGDEEIEFDEAGEYWIYVNIEVTDATANNRATWRLLVDHLNNGSVSQFPYVVGSSNYIRDDAAGYDSGGIGGFIALVVGAGDKIKITSERLDTGAASSNNYADQTKSYLRIERKTYTLS